MRSSQTKSKAVSAEKVVKFQMSAEQAESGNNSCDMDSDIVRGDEESDTERAPKSMFQKSAVNPVQLSAKQFQIQSQNYNPPHKSSVNYQPFKKYEH